MTDFQLTAPVPPCEIRAPVPHEEAMNEAMRRAIGAALRGEFDDLERLEVHFLNVLVRVGELFVKDANGTPHWWFNPDDARFKRLDHERYAPFVVRVLRGFTFEGHAALEWQVREKCRRCDGKLRHVECRVCGGDWFVSTFEDRETLYTDLDGVILGACDV